MARYNGINHLAMITRDMDETIRFWRDLLGMRLVAGLGSKIYRHYFFEISPTDLIAFFEWPGDAKVMMKDHGVPSAKPMVFDHVSIGVECMEDIVELKKKLTAAGFWVSEIMDHGFIHSIYSFDPNHIPLEFSCRIREVDIRKRPQMKDPQPSAAALEGSEPQSGQWPEPSETDHIDLAVYPGEGTILAEE
ncbi:MAG: VOC family protein [Desulfobacteraceae bacterium]|nr:MAG: VOC family protein [Desulfobacteraceae bacterium]